MNCFGVSLSLNIGRLMAGLSLIQSGSGGQFPQDGGGQGFADERSRKS